MKTVICIDNKGTKFFKTCLLFKKVSLGYFHLPPFSCFMQMMALMPHFRYCSHLFPNLNSLIPKLRCLLDVIWMTTNILKYTYPCVSLLPCVLNIFFPDFIFLFLIIVLPYIFPTITNIIWICLTCCLEDQLLM